MTTQRTALLSAYDKEDLESFASHLDARDWNLLASAGTTKYLAGKGIKARDVSEIVGPPILGHRVVTLSREIYAALLATDSPEDQAELDRLGIPRIDLVYVNLYPLVEEIARPGHTLKSVIEKTDIGDPTILRAAAKGRRIVVCRQKEFIEALTLVDDEEMDSDIREKKISLLACIAEHEVSRYCAASSEYLRAVSGFF